MDTMKYTTCNGVTQYKPSIQLLKELHFDGEGFCLGCGTPVVNVEPDAQRYECPHCGALKVYGAEELILMGLCFDEEDK